MSKKFIYVGSAIMVVFMVAMSVVNGAEMVTNNGLTWKDIALFWLVAFSLGFMVSGVFSMWISDR